MNRLEPILGPLAIEECRRAVRRRWLVGGRFVGVAAACAVAVGALWLLWMAGQFGTSVGWGATILWGAAAVEAIWLVAALALTPALVAGSIASEKHHGTLELLLISRTSTAGVIGARFLGLYAQVAMILLAGLPPLILLASAASLSLGAILLMVALPLCVAAGAAGVTMLCSTLARQARDVLIIIYALEIGVFVAVAAIGASSLLTPAADALIGSLNPFVAFGHSAYLATAVPMLFSCGAWLALGAAGVAASIWQLWPAYRRHVDRSSTKRKVRERRTRTCPDVRPMVWKETHVDHGALFGRIGRWLVILLTTLVVATCIPPLAILVSAWFGSQPFASAWVLSDEIGDNGMYLSWLMQWLVGLRATAAIAAERQRSTWDMLLTSPLEDREILWGKVWGSVYSLRWLVAAALASWTLALAAGTMSASWWAFLVADLLAGGAFIVVVGLAVSVASTGTTRAMATTVGYWIAAAIGTAIGAGMTAGMLLFAVMFLDMFLQNGILGAQGRLPTSAVDMIFTYAFHITRPALLAFLTFMAWKILIAWFDRRSGRAAVVTRTFVPPPPRAPSPEPQPLSVVDISK